MRQPWFELGYPLAPVSLFNGRWSIPMSSIHDFWRNDLVQGRGGGGGAAASSGPTTKSKGGRGGRRSAKNNAAAASAAQASVEPATTYPSSQPTPGSEDKPYNCIRKSYFQVLGNLFCLRPLTVEKNSFCVLFWKQKLYFQRLSVSGV